MGNINPVDDFGSSSRRCTRRKKVDGRSAVLLRRKSDTRRNILSQKEERNGTKGKESQRGTDGKQQGDAKQNEVKQSRAEQAYGGREDIKWTGDGRKGRVQWRMD